MVPPPWASMKAHASKVLVTFHGLHLQTYSSSCGHMAGEDAQIARAPQRAEAVEPVPPDFQETQVEEERCGPITQLVISCLCVSNF